jgi:hypothetical protein
VERVIGSIRRECLHHVIVVNAAGLHRVLTDFITYYMAIWTTSRRISTCTPGVPRQYSSVVRSPTQTPQSETRDVTPFDGVCQ